MPFEVFNTDMVSLLKQNGERVDNIKCSVQTDKIFIDRSDILIEPGDIIQRKMSNGGQEIFKVIDPRFSEAFHQIPAGYQMRVKKLGLPEARKATQKITYNLNGNNAKVNNNSIDNSTNIIHLNDDIKEYVTKLRQEINNFIESQEEKESSLELVSAIEAQFKLEKPNKTVVATLVNALPTVGNIATIGSLILSLFS